MVINLNRQLVTKKLLLKHVQDVRIYQFYSNKEVILKKKIKSPLRTEKNASFGYFLSNNGEIWFKDFVLGAGDCIKFVQLMFGLNFFEALSRIVVDFGLQKHFIYKISDKTNKVYNPNNYEKRDKILSKANNFKLGKTKRNWQAYDLNFWWQFGIDLATLKKYRVQPISFIFINGNPIKADKYAYCFIEQKDGKQTYKIYQPFNKQFKWLNNHNNSIWQGWEQLPKKGEKLIITKSLKDVMSITNMLGIPSVSLQAESAKPKKHVVKELESRFDIINLLYDNDYDKQKNWGQLYANELCNIFGFTNLIIPEYFNSKDFSDLVKNSDNFETGFTFADKYSSSDKTRKEKIKTIWESNVRMPF